ncbi:MAG TPA: hypothetical protein VLM40_15950 [Gemmata sp.]|nr:hypothetical protein [Gemmata sp.]
MSRSGFAVGICLIAVSLGLFSTQSRAAGPYDELLKRAPSSSNVLAMIDAKSAYSSELAKKEGWKEKGQAGHRGLGFVPPDASLVVVAADVNLNTMTRYFQLGIVKVAQAPVLKNLAAFEGGSLDRIADEFVVWSPRNVYFTNLTATELQAIAPADRQMTARWLRAVKANRTGDLSTYLRQAADAAGKNTITIAMNLQDAVDKNVLALMLPSSPTIAKNKNLEIPTLAGFLANVKGMTFSARIDDAIHAGITIDFGLDPSRYRRVLPELFRELLEGQGIAIAGLESWQPTFTDTGMTLSGNLNTADLKRIVSLLSFPSPAGEIDPMSKQGEPTASATKRYLSAVDSILMDISKTKDNPNYDKTATWHVKAASQVENLSKRGVDPVAVAAAAEAAARLHAIADSLRGVPIEVSALEKTAYHTTRPSLGMSYGGPWGWRPFIMGQVDSNIPQVREQMMKVIADDQKRRQQTWATIDEIMGDARRKMAEKYRIKF